MIKGKIFCLVFLFLFFGMFFNLVCAGLKLGSFFNLTDKPVDLEISALKDTDKALHGNIPAIKIRIAKNSSAKLDQFSFETIEGPSTGFLIIYYFANQKRKTKNELRIRYKYLIVDDKNCSKLGLCPFGYMASIYIGTSLYKNIYSPISQKNGFIDLNLTCQGLQLGGSVQVLDPEFNK